MKARPAGIAGGLLGVILSAGVTAQAPPVHAPDGDSGPNFTTSIFIPSLPNAAFSATVNTEETRYLPVGAAFVTKNHRLIARDGQGRIFQERRGIAPEGTPMESQLTSTEVADPTARTITSCNPQTRVCEIRAYRPVTTWVLPDLGPSANGNSYVTRQDLGRQTTDGLELVGTRETVTVTGANAEPLQVTKDFWYSPRLGINVTTRRWDPRIQRVEQFTVTDVRLSPPDLALFTLPADARVVDLRPPAAPR